MKTLIFSSLLALALTASRIPSGGDASSTPSSDASASSSSPSSSSDASSSASSSDSSGGGGGSASQDQFKQALLCYPGATDDTVGKVDVGANYNSYKSSIPSDMSLMEQAMLLTNIVWETAHLQFMEEIACKDGHCEYGKYYGRGCIQLTWEANYKEASQAIYQSDKLLTEPDLVAKPEDAWKTALWFWKEKVKKTAASGFVDKKDLGAAVKVINGALECAGSPNEKAQKRLTIFNCIIEKWKLSGPGTLDGCK